MQWQQCNAKRGQSTAGQPGTLLLPVACGGAGQSGMSLAVWRPVARGAGARERTRARPPWSSPLSSRLMRSTCLDPGGLAWTRPAPRCLPLIIDEDSMLRLRAVASSACIAFRAQLRGTDSGQPGRAAPAPLLPSRPVRVLVAPWSGGLSRSHSRWRGAMASMGGRVVPTARIRIDVAPPPRPAGRWARTRHCVRSDEMSTRGGQE